MMDEVKRLQFLAEIKVNKPSNFRQIPFSIFKDVLKNDMRELYSELNHDDVEELIQEIDSCYNFYDVLYFLEGQGHNRMEAVEIIFDTLVNKDE